MYVANHGDEWKYVNLTAAYFRLWAIYLAVGWEIHVYGRKPLTELSEIAFLQPHL